MKSLSSVGLALSIVFGCLLLALVAELYYLLWWKRKRITNSEVEDDYRSPGRELLYMFCWKKPSSLTSTALNPQEICSSMRIAETHVHEPQALLYANHPNKDLWPKAFGEDEVEAELMRLESLSGPPRFLFTIKEETKEDLESEDGNSRGEKSGKGSRSRSLSDLVLTVETPFLTPIASPPYFTPPLTPINSSYSHQGFNPLFESSTDAEFNRLKSSPPPMFKFLKDAEDKLHRRTLMEESDLGFHKMEGSGQEGARSSATSVFLKDEEYESFITLIVANNKEKELSHPHHKPPLHPSSSSQVLPIVSSPSTFRPPTNKKPISH